MPAAHSNYTPPVRAVAGGAVRLPPSQDGNGHHREEIRMAFEDAEAPAFVLGADGRGVGNVGDDGCRRGNDEPHHDAPAASFWRASSSVPTM